MAEPAVWNVVVLAGVTYLLPKNLEIKLGEGQFICLPAGEIRIERALNEEEHGGFYSVKVLVRGKDLGWVLIKDLRYGREDVASEIYKEIIDALQ